MLVTFKQHMKNVWLNLVNILNFSMHLFSDLLQHFFDQLEKENRKNGSNIQGL